MTREQIIKHYKDMLKTYRDNGLLSFAQWAEMDTVFNILVFDLNAIHEVETHQARMNAFDEITNIIGLNKDTESGNFWETH